MAARRNLIVLFTNNCSPGFLKRKSRILFLWELVELIVQKDYQAVGKKAGPLLRHGLLSKTIVAEFISHVPLYEGDKN